MTSSVPKKRQAADGYAPQVGSWKDYTTFHFRCAIAIEGVRKDETFGVAEGDSRTIVDHESRMVAMIPATGEAPGSSATLPADENWNEVRQHVPANQSESFLKQSVAL